MSSVSDRDLNGVTTVTGVVEKGDPVSRGGGRGRSQKLNALLRGGATEEASLRRHPLQLTGPSVAQYDGQAALELQKQQQLSDIVYFSE